MKKAIISTLLCALFVTSACTKSGSDSSDSDSSSNDPAGPGEVRSECGVVINEELKNPVKLADGLSVRIKSASGGNLLVLDTGSGEVLMKLHNLNTASGLEEAANNFIMQAAAGTVTYFQVSSGCTAQVPGGNAANGQIITASGRSLSEELIINGFADRFSLSGTCGEGLVGSCYQALRESSAERVAGSVRRFLWKPKADGEVSKGRLVVLSDVCNADIIVNGEHLEYDGPNNGYCSIGRAPKTGCAYGGNVRVEIRRPEDDASYLFPDGKRFFTIPNGCNRVEF